MRGPEFAFCRLLKAAGVPVIDQKATRILQ
jgi:hypothetical protein